MQGEEGSKQQRIDKLLENVRERLASGDEIDEQGILTQHPDLLPELTIQLRMTIRIYQVKATEGFGKESPGEARYDHLRKALADERPEYNIGELLGAGGQGAVFRASHMTLKRDVAIKVLIHGQFATKRQRERFLREVEISARMQHENIAIVYDCGLVEQCPYAVMEYVQGTNLSDYLALEKPDITSRLRLMQKIATGVNYAHQRGVIHRDLKPPNILVTDDGQPKIVDFGLAKSLSEDGANSVFSRADEVVGTLQYFSPEQAAGESGLVDVRTDVYGLGLVFYEMVTGRLPYPIAAGTQALKDGIISTPPSPLAPTLLDGSDQRISKSKAKDIEAIVLQSLEKRQEDRYQTAQELLDDLNRYFRGEPVEARSQTFLYLAAKLARRHRRAVIVAAAFAILLVLSTAISTTLYYRATFQRDRAVGAVKFSDRIFDYLLTEIDYGLSRVPGGTLLQKQLGQQLIEELARLQRLQVDLDVPAASKARLAYNIAVIYGQLGQADEASDSFEQARDFAEAAGDNAAATAIAVQIEMAPDNELGITELDSAARGARDFGLKYPENLEYQILEARALMVATRLATRIHHFNRAIELGERVLAIRPHIKNRNRIDRIQSETYRWLGTTYEAVGRCDTAEAYFEKALAQVEEILERQPADIRARQNRLRFRIGFIDASSRNDNFKRSKSLLSEAKEDAELLEEICPDDALVMFDVLSFWNQVALNDIRMFLREKSGTSSGSPSKLRQLFGEAERTLDDNAERIVRAVAAFPSEEAILHQAAVHEYLLFFLLRADDSMKALAEDALDRAIGKSRHIIKEWPNYEPVQSTLADALTALANIYLATDRIDQAIDLATEARSIRHRQLKRSPSSLNANISWIWARYLFCDIDVVMGDTNSTLKTLNQLKIEAIDLEATFGKSCQSQRLKKLKDRINRAITKLKAK